MTASEPAVERAEETVLDAGDLLIAIAEECAGMAAIMEDLQGYLGSQLSEGRIDPDRATVQQFQEIDRITQTLADLGGLSGTIGMHLMGKTIPERDVRDALRLRSLTDRLTKR